MIGNPNTTKRAPMDNGPLIKQIEHINTAKSTLARLLAKEDIEIRTGNYPTAAFDVAERILLLPQWDFSNVHLLDMVIGHEVSHALNTSYSTLKTVLDMGLQYKDVYNIIEDIRIDRMIQETYPGLISSYNKAYDHLIQQDFFGLNQLNGDLSGIKFLDRLNLHGKAGRHIQVPLNPTELDFYNRCLSAKTEDQVLALVREAIKMIGDEQLAQPKHEILPDGPQNGDGAAEKTDLNPLKSNVPLKPNDVPSEEGEGQGPAQPLSDTPGTTEPSPSNKVSDQQDDQSTKEPGTSDGAPASDNSKTDKTEKPIDFSSTTQKKLNSLIADAARPTSGPTTLYCPADAKLRSVITPFAAVSKARHETSRMFSLKDPGGETGYLTFKKKNEAKVNVLVREFERKKAAFQYSRAKVSRCGTINTNALYRYKISDDIFQSVMIQADAKNHGMIMLVDYSSSMRGSISAVLEQVFNLVLFCKKVKIPFEVYGFTSGSQSPNPHGARRAEMLNEVNISNLNIFEIISSNLSRAECERSLRELYCQSQIFIQTGIERMESTPLTEAILVINSVIRRMKSQNNIQKMIGIFLTDGEGQEIPGRPSLVINGKMIKSSQSNMWLLNHIAKVHNCKNVAFYLSDSRWLNSAHSAFNIKNFWANKNALSRELGKNGFIHVTADGYSDVFILTPKGLKSNDHSSLGSSSQTYDVNDRASIRALSTKFSDVASSARSSRIIMNKFAEVIA